MLLVSLPPPSRAAWVTTALARLLLLLLLLLPVLLVRGSIHSSFAAGDVVAACVNVEHRAFASQLRVCCLLAALSVSRPSSRRTDMARSRLNTAMSPRLSHQSCELCVCMDCMVGGWEGNQALFWGICIVYIKYTVCVFVKYTNMVVKDEKVVIHSLAMYGFFLFIMYESPHRRRDVPSARCGF